MIILPCPGPTVKKSVASLQPSNAETLEVNSVHNDSLNCSIIFWRFLLARDCHLLQSSTPLPLSQTLVDISFPILSSNDFVCGFVYFWEMYINNILYLSSRVLSIIFLHILITSNSVLSLCLLKYFHLFTLS